MGLKDATVTNTVALLDANLDDMNDLPSWKVFPAGVYLVKPEVTIESKKNKTTKKDETQITIGATLIEIRELDDPSTPDDKKPVVGDVTSARFTWENEFGQGALKEILKPIAAATGKTKAMELLEILGAQDSILMVMGVRTKSVEGKPDQEYQSIVNVIVE